MTAATDLVASVAVGRSVRSRSANAIEPVSLNTPDPSVMAPATSVAVIVGTSLVPVMVTVTSWVAVPN